MVTSRLPLLTALKKEPGGDATHTQAEPETLDRGEFLRVEVPRRWREYVRVCRAYRLKRISPQEFETELLEIFEAGTYERSMRLPEDCIPQIHRLLQAAFNKPALLEHARQRGEGQRRIKSWHESYLFFCKKLKLPTFNLPTLLRAIDANNELLSLDLHEQNAETQIAALNQMVFAYARQHSLQITQRWYWRPRKETPQPINTNSAKHKERHAA